MKVSLLYNHDAGEGVSAETLRQELERGGHEVAHAVHEDSELERALEEAPDLLVAAGGDGTVWRAASALAGRGIPLAILPLGTANNIAKSHGIDGSVAEVIGGWRAARRVRLDLGVARGGWGETRFIEGVGGGLISAGITEMQRGPSRDEADDEEEIEGKLELALRTYRDVLARLRPRRLTTTLDGIRIDGDFLLFEVLNIRSVGPNLVLSPDADPSDGSFDVVMAGDEHRAELDALLSGGIQGSQHRLTLPTRRALNVEISGWEEMHVDDEVRSGPSIGTVSVRMQAAALEILV